MSVTCTLHSSTQDVWWPNTPLPFCTLHISISSNTFASPWTPRSPAPSPPSDTSLSSPRTLIPPRIPHSTTSSSSSDPNNLLLLRPFFLLSSPPSHPRPQTQTPSSPPTSTLPSYASAHGPVRRRAATCYAAALADAALCAGALGPAARCAGASRSAPSGPYPTLRRRRRRRKVAGEARGGDGEVAGGKGEGGMVAEVVAEFVRICDELGATETVLVEKQARRRGRVKKTYPSMSTFVPGVSKEWMSRKGIRGGVDTS
uniref:Uncharacterized protein n=1 Tax=Ananas comosus var. bracteatus TaxID=296719 RepID=A0A6V7PHY0_ANACO|nr:unnamed protein product [Ananas comosus var. bracteatus]